MIYTIGAIVASIFYLFVGLLTARRVNNIEDYYVSGRNASTLFLVSSLVASYLSTIVFMGDAGFAYDGYVIPLLIMSIFVMPGYVIGVLFFGRYLRRSEALTLPEYFGKRFNSRSVRVVSSLTLIVGIIAYLVAITQGVGILFSEITGMDYQKALVLVVVLYTSITFLSGAKGVIWIDTIMFLIFTIATFIAIPYIVDAAGGFIEAIKGLKSIGEKPDLLSWHGVTGERNYMGKPLDIFFYTAIIGLVWGVVLAVSPWQASSYLMAKSEHVAIRSAILSTIVISVMYLVVHLSMTTINILNPNLEPSERVFIWSVIQYVPKGLGVIAISGIFAATLATGSAFLQLIANSVAQDLFNGEKLARKDFLLVSRLMVIVVALVGYLITRYQPPAMFWIAIFAGTVFAASWGPIAFASVLTDRVTKEGAFWSITIGFASVLVMEGLLLLELFELPLYINSALIGFLCSLSTLIIVTRQTTPTEHERNYYKKLMITPHEEQDPSEIKRTLKYPYILIGAGVLITAVTYYCYYLPYSGI